MGIGILELRAVGDGSRICLLHSSVRLVDSRCGVVVCYESCVGEVLCDSLASALDLWIGEVKISGTARTTRTRPLTRKLSLHF